MQHLLDQLVFKTADREYRWSDVVLAARVWGDWQMLERRVREDLACQTAMRKAGETLDADDVEAAADEFRYAHDLLSAEETDQWLEQWGLSADAWMDYIHRVVLRNRWERNAATLLARYAPSSEEIERAIAAEAVCSGELARLARRLAGRAAVISRSIEAGDRSIDSDERASSIVTHRRRAGGRAARRRRSDGIRGRAGRGGRARALRPAGGQFSSLFPAARHS